MTTYKRHLATNPNLDLKTLLLTLHGPSMQHGDSSPYNALDVLTSKSLNFVNTDLKCSERFLCAIQALGLTHVEFANLIGADHNITKKLTYIVDPNPRISTLVKWSKSKIGCSILIYVFYPKIHNRLVMKI